VRKNTNAAFYFLAALIQVKTVVAGESCLVRRGYRGGVAGDYSDAESLRCAVTALWCVAAKTSVCAVDASERTTSLAHIDAGPPLPLPRTPRGRRFRWRRIADAPRGR